MPKVVVKPGDVEVEVDFGAPLIEAVAMAIETRPDIFNELDLFNDCECHGFVEVLEGDNRLRAIQPGELKAFRARGIPLGTAPIRQICQAMVMGNVTVRILKRFSPRHSC